MADFFSRYEDDEEKKKPSQIAADQQQSKGDFFTKFESGVRTEQNALAAQPDQNQDQQPEKQVFLSRVGGFFRSLTEKKETPKQEADTGISSFQPPSQTLGQRVSEAGYVIDESGNLVRPGQDNFQAAKDVTNSIAPVFVEQLYQDQYSRLSDLQTKQINGDKLSAVEKLELKGLTQNVDALQRMKTTPTDQWTMQDRNTLLVLQTGRGSRAFASSAVSLGQSFVGFAAQLSDFIGADQTAENLVESQNKIDAWRQQAIDFRDRDIIDEVATGIASTGAFLIGGNVIAGGAKALSLLSPVAANLFAGSVAATLEASAESGAVYTENINNGKSKEEALNAANATFALNVVLNQFTNQFGFFGEQKTILKRLLASSSAESIQEMSQQVISNVATGQPPLSGVFMSGAIAAFTGGGLSIVTGEISAPADLPEQKIQTADNDPTVQAIQNLIEEKPSQTITQEEEPPVDQPPEGGARVESLDNKTLYRGSNGQVSEEQKSFGPEVIASVVQREDVLNPGSAEGNTLDNVSSQFNQITDEMVSFFGENNASIRAVALGSPGQARFIGEINGKSTVQGQTVAQVAAQLAETIRDNTQTRQFDYSSTQLNLPQEVASQVLSVANSIPESSLAEDGRETQPHTTVLYGLETQSAEDVRAIVEKFPPIELTLGKISLFENEDQDILKIDVSSPVLTELNKQLDNSLDTPGKTFSDYKPHITIAYLKKGEGKQFVGDTRFEGQKITLNELAFSNKSGEQVSIPLSGEAVPGLAPTEKQSEKKEADSKDNQGKRQKVKQNAKVPPSNANKNAANKRKSKARQAVTDGKIRLHGVNFATHLAEKYGKSLLDATKTEIRKSIMTTKVVIEGDVSGQMIDDIGTSSKGDDYKGRVRGVSAYGRTLSFTKMKDVYTDGFFAITKKDVATDLNSQVKQFMVDQTATELFKSGEYSKDQARVEAEKLIEERINDAEEPPTKFLNQILEGNGESNIQLYFQGISGNGTNILSVFTTGKLQIAFNTDILAFLRDSLGSDIQLFTNGDPKKPVYIRSAGELVGVVMPYLQADGFNFPPSINYPSVAKPETMGGSSSGVYASKGDFREDVPIELGKIETLRSIQIPEMVLLAKDLMDGKFPVSKKIRSDARGFFRPGGSGEIVISKDLFREANQQQLAKTLAHEIGHLVDYVPDQNMARGNIIGRIHSLSRFMRSQFTSLDNEAEISRLTGEREQMTEQRKNAETGSAENRKLLAQIKATNIKIQKLKEKVSLDNQVVFNELYAASKYWRPFDESTAKESFLKYRKSSKELYADAISMLFNSPGTLQRMAPKFYEAFFENLDKKPDVKRDYFAIQALYDSGSAATLKARQENIENMFVKGEALRTQMEKEKGLRNTRVWERLRQQYDDINYPILKKVKEAEAKGAIIAPENNPKYLLEELSLSDNETYQFAARVSNDVLKVIGESGVTDTQLGSFLFLKRIVGRPDSSIEEQLGIPEGSLENVVSNEELRQLLVETGRYDKSELDAIDDLVAQLRDRREIANPLGFARDSAQAQLDFLQTQYTPEQWESLNTAATAFHDLIFESVEEAVEVGAYNKETYEKLIKPNKDYYVSFGVLNYLQDFVPATVKKQAGTLSEVENPFVTTVLKTIALKKLILKQRAANATRDLLLENFSAEITKARKTVYGFANPRSKDVGHLTILEDGKLQAYEVDKYIADSFERGNYGDLNLAVAMLRKVNNTVFLPLYITWNPGFIFAMNPIKDFKRMYKNNPDISLGRMVYEYAKALKPAVKRQLGIDDAIINDLVENKAIDVPMSSFALEESDTAVDRILKRFNLKGEEKTTREKIVSYVTIPLRAMEFAGGVVETLPKVAAYNSLAKKGLNKKEIAYRVRNYVGTPNFRRGGKYTQTTNVLFMFSNIMKEGLKSDIQVATDPKTASGYWFRSAQVALVPKALMVAAAAGLFGDELEKWFQKVSEYDKTNYLIIPFGEDENGKAVYIRVPQDETGRLMSGMMWKMFGIASGKPKSLHQIFDFGADIMPTLSPIFGIGTDWFQFLSGKNPYDEWRGRPVLDDATFEAGGYPALKKMIEWTWNEVGLGGYYQFTTYDNSSQSTTETTVKAIPVLNRLLKVSDYGLKESGQAELQKIQKQQATERLAKKDVVKKYADEITAGSRGFTEGTIRQIEKEAFPNERITAQQRSALRKQLGQYVLRAENDPFVSNLIYSQSNEEKLEVVRQMYDNRNASEVDKTLKKMLQYKVIGADFYYKALREK